VSRRGLLICAGCPVTSSAARSGRAIECGSAIRDAGLARRIETLAGLHTEKIGRPSTSRYTHHPCDESGRVWDWLHRREYRSGKRLSPGTTDTLRSVFALTDPKPSATRQPRWPATTEALTQAMVLVSRNRDAERRRRKGQ
jgi:hypothetical protein